MQKQELRSPPSPSPGLTTWEGQPLWIGQEPLGRCVYLAPLTEGDFIAEGVLETSTEVVFLIRVRASDVGRFTRQMTIEAADVTRCSQLPFDGGVADGPTSQPKGQRPSPKLPD